MERENPLKFMACAAAALVAGVAFSIPQVADNFESEPLDSGWTGGGGTIVAGVATAPSCGFDSNFPASTHTKVLSVSGEATRANPSSLTTTKQSQADFLVNITEASDADTFGSTLTDVKIAIAAGSAIDSSGDEDTVPLMINCKPKSGSDLGAVNWITGPSVTTGAWHRVSLVFDYTSGLCKVSVDGVPYVSEYGFLKAATSDLNIEAYESKDGAWYGMASNDTTTATGAIQSLSFVGVASVDDVLIDGGAAVTESFSGSGATVGGLNVSYEQLNKWGVTSDTIETAELDNSGMTVAEKVVAGLVGDSMTDGTKFEAKAMKMTSATQAAITLPAGITTDNRTYTVKYKADGGDETAVAPGNVSITAGVLTVSELPENATVLTFTITASASATQN